MIQSADGKTPGETHEIVISKRWQTHFSQLLRMSLYTKKGDKMSIGAADLDEIEYSFVQDRLLLSVTITAKYKLNCVRLRDAMIAGYGEPLDDKAESALWVDEVVTISYQYGRYKDAATVHIFSNKIFDRLVAAKKQLAEQGVKDF